MVEESIDGIDAADGRRLPPNSPWLRVVSGAGFVCGLAGRQFLAPSETGLCSG